MNYSKSILSLFTRNLINPLHSSSIWSPACLSRTNSHNGNILSTRKIWKSAVRFEEKKIENYEEGPEKEDIFKPLKHEDMCILHNCGEEMSGSLDKSKMLSVLNQFYSDNIVRELLSEHGIKDNLFQQAIKSFRNYCIKATSLPTELHILFYDLCAPLSMRHIHDMFPYFIKHTEEIFPHLTCMDDLSKISDLSEPLYWFPHARAMKGRVIFHAGPTNSGKTHHAMKRFLEAKTGRYHGPLKMLAVEVFQKSNSLDKPCDLFTGEEKLYIVSEDKPASHAASTVEMAVVDKECEVAIIDEIQMINNNSRGWAWTRALLGIPARELHVCGESSALELVRQLVEEAGDSFEIREYKRLTKLTVEESALVKLDNVQPGDCIVCFSLRDIHTSAKYVEKLGHEVAIIYGDLPPGTKSAQSKKFNDPKHKCNIMVATDAIGMGLNLNIRRIIFFSLVKVAKSEIGENKLRSLTVSETLQVAGRAGRYGTQFEEGYVTTLNPADHRKLKKLMTSLPGVIEQAGLRPTIDQIELFAFHLRNYDLSELIEIFVKVCTIDDLRFFMCDLTDFKEAANILKDVKLNLKSKYVFCLSPVSLKKKFPRFMMREFAVQYSKNIPVDYEFLRRHMKWPFNVPKTPLELSNLEEIHEVFTLYLWLSYRFEDLFPHRDIIREVQTELDEIILEGISNLISLLGRESLKTEWLHNKLKSIKSRNELNNLKISVKKSRLAVESDGCPDSNLVRGHNISGILKNINFKPKKR